jgi:F0F1-type ATP synthase membrane subunit b/b'
VIALAESIQLVPDGTLLLHVLLIVIMVSLLSRTLFRPMNAVLEERESFTKGQSNEAKEIRKRVSEMMTQYEHGLREARTQGYALLERKKAESLKEREARVHSVKEEIDKWVAQQKEALRTQSDEASNSLQAESHATALKIASRILQRPIGENG